MLEIEVESYCEECIRGASMRQETVFETPSMLACPHSLGYHALMTLSLSDVPCSSLLPGTVS